VTHVPLREGENRVLITARNTDFAKSVKEIVIRRSGDEDVDVPTLTEMRNPDAVAVVIGISKYKGDMPPVDFARRDAETVKSYLVRTLGYDARKIIEAYDEQADRTSLVTALFDDLPRRIVPGKSDVFVFYSGHGIPDIDGKEAVKDAYLAPYDFRSSSTQRTGIALKELYQEMEKLGARSVTIVMDACFSGYSGDNQPLIKSASSIALRVVNPVLKGPNSVVLTSSSDKQVSSWYHQKRHGLFTYYFLQGLKGKADLNQDGVVTVGELEKHLGSTVPGQALALYNREQIPEVMGNREAVLVRLK
jgi:uncharacterized caspase-like protein